jgi:hypothetical protein
MISMEAARVMEILIVWWFAGVVKSLTEQH